MCHSSLTDTFTTDSQFITVLYISSLGCFNYLPKTDSWSSRQIYVFSEVNHFGEDQLNLCVVKSDIMLFLSKSSKEVQQFTEQSADSIANGNLNSSKQFRTTYKRRIYYFETREKVMRGALGTAHYVGRKNSYLLDLETIGFIHRPQFKERLKKVVRGGSNCTRSSWRLQQYFRSGKSNLNSMLMTYSFTH